MRSEISKRNKLEAGFTLIELLLALAITGIVISLTGSGLYALMNANQRSQNETTERLDLERAVAFMTDEIKMSQQIMTSIPTGSKGEKIFKSASGSSSVQVVLVLKPASNSGLINPIIYYLADPPNSSVWLGPRVIYRWGPTLLQTGDYSNSDGVDIVKVKPSGVVEYFNEVIVDHVSDLVLDKSKIDCSSGYNYFDLNISSKIKDNSGFYACIAPDQKSVEFWIYKQANSSNKNTMINTLVLTRSN